MNFSDDVIQDYATEASEKLHWIRENLVLLENKSVEIMNELMRSYHSIKGGAGFLSLDPIVVLCHHLEAIFDALRTNKISMSQGVIDSVLQGNDALEQMLDALRHSKRPSDCDKSLLVKLNQLVAAKSKTHSVKADLVDWSQFQYDDLIKDIQNKKNIAKEKNHSKNKTQALSKLFKKFPPLVGDLAKKLGKEVNFIISGEKIKIQQDIIDVLFDPLVHLIRNALDHGIEKPAFRKSAHKPHVGCIQIAAKKDGDTLIISLSDDGEGIDAVLVLKKALDLDLLTEAKAKTLKESEIFELILTPGFSTREEVNDLSGRGFGMDAVKNQIDALHGKLIITSIRKKGTQFELRIPLSPVMKSEGARK